MSGAAPVHALVLPAHVQEVQASALLPVLLLRLLSTMPPHYTFTAQTHTL
jgi:hypothetical protein